MRTRIGGWLAIAPVLACTTSNPAFDDAADAAADRGDHSDGSDTKTDSPDATDTGATNDGETTTTSDSGDGVCAVAPPAEVVLTAVQLEAVGCPDEFIRGTVLDRGLASFSLMDCNGCDPCTGSAWTITASGLAIPDQLQVGDCLDVHFDCANASLPEVPNLAIMHGTTAQLLIAAPKLPVSIGGWGPLEMGGEPCPTESCPDNTQMLLDFTGQIFREGEGGTATLQIAGSNVEMTVRVTNAQHDPETCEETILWTGRPL